MALEMKVFKDIASYEAKPMLGCTWRQLAALAIMILVGGGLFALVTYLGISKGGSMESASSVAMWLIWPVLLPSAFWGWWRPKGLKPEKYLSFALRENFMKKEVVYGTAQGTSAESVVSGGKRTQKTRKKQIKNIHKSISEHEPKTKK